MMAGSVSLILVDPAGVVAAGGAGVVVWIGVGSEGCAADCADVEDEDWPQPAQTVSIAVTIKVILSRCMQASRVIVGLRARYEHGRCAMSGACQSASWCQLETCPSRATAQVFST